MGYQFNYEKVAALVKLLHLIHTFCHLGKKKSFILNEVCNFWKLVKYGGKG